MTDAATETATGCRKAPFPIRNCIFYLAGALLILGMKCYYREADCDSLLWILGPTVWWVQLLSGIPFTYLSGTGYVNHDLRLLIAPSCSGVRFMIVLFATLVFSFVHAVSSPGTHGESGSLQSCRRISPGPGAFRPWAGGFCWIAASAVISWLFTILVNGLRIITAIYLPLYLENAGLMDGILTQDRLHTMIGAVIYFIALLTIYRLAAWMIRRRQNRAFLPSLLHRFAPPVFWYFALTLGLPLLHRMVRGSAAGFTEFTEFTVLVVSCCALVLLPWAAVLLLRKLLTLRKQR